MKHHSLQPHHYLPYIDSLYDESIKKAVKVMEEHTSLETKRAYNGDIIYIKAWLKAIGFSFKKAITIKEIVLFIIQHAEGMDPKVDAYLVEHKFKYQLGTHKMATIKRRLTSLSIFLERAQLPNPTKDKEIKILLAKLTKKHGGPQPNGKAITRYILEDILDTCDPTKVIDIRDRAMLLFGWGSGGRRRSEIADALLENLNEDENGEFIYTIPKSKTDQTSQGYKVPARGRVALALKKWLSVSGITSGYLFRSITRNKTFGEKLNHNDIYRIVTKRLELAGYNHKEFCAHGLRSGFVTEAGRRNKPLGDVMAMTMHKDVKTVMKYYQAGSIINNSTARMLDE